MFHYSNKDHTLNAARKLIGRQVVGEIHGGMIEVKEVEEGD